MKEHTFKRHSSGGIVNTDLEGLRAYKERKRRIREVESLREDINSIKDQLSQILTLLSEKGS